MAGCHIRFQIYCNREVKIVAKKEEIKVTALYERLSRDDEQAGESNSISDNTAGKDIYTGYGGAVCLRMSVEPIPSRSSL